MVPKAAAPRPGFSLGFRVQSAGLVSGIACRVFGSDRRRVSGLGFRVQGLGEGFGRPVSWWTCGVSILAAAVIIGICMYNLLSQRESVCVVCVCSVCVRVV
jgi:hypothetical protein